MSWKASGYVKELRDNLTITEKFVLLVLADYHNTEMASSWPSMPTLASDCLMTERAVQQIVHRLAEKKFICRAIGGGRGRINGYSIAGVDYPAPTNGVLETPNVQTVLKTPHSQRRNPAQPRNAIRKEPNEPLNRERVCKIHPNSGRTVRGGCWDCYAERHRA